MYEVKRQINKWRVQLNVTIFKSLLFKFLYFQPSNKDMSEAYEFEGLDGLKEIII